MGPPGDAANIDPRLGSLGAMAWNTYARWFSRLMWLGIAANVALALVSIIWTERVLGFLGLELANPIVWPRFGAFLLILLSIYYIPSAINPLIYRYSAAVSILCRFGGFFFFAAVGGRYIIFGLFDLSFGLPQAILLLRAWQLTQARSR
jgi:hypothetical protein